MEGQLEEAVTGGEELLDGHSKLLY